MFYESHGPAGTFNLKDSNFESECQKFVHKYQEIQNQMPGCSEEEIFIITNEKIGYGINARGGNENEEEKSSTEIKRSSIDVSKLW